MFELTHKRFDCTWIISDNRTVGSCRSNFKPTKLVAIGEQT